MATQEASPNGIDSVFHLASIFFYGAYPTADLTMLEDRATPVFLESFLPARVRENRPLIKFLYRPLLLLHNSRFAI